jgi:hypothetical protein
LLILTNKLFNYKIKLTVEILKKEVNMSRESKHRKDQRKKPSMTLKERRAKKHEKKQHKPEHLIGDIIIE